MKKLILVASLLLVMSCKKETVQKDEQDFKLEVTFNNGDKDTLEFRSKEFIFYQGNIRKWNSPQEDETLASGVRTFKILNK